MIPIEQVNLAGMRGDCFAACVASILEVPLSAVPHFMLLGLMRGPNLDGATEIAFGCLQEWLRPKNMVASLIRADDGSLPPAGYHLAIVPSIALPGMGHAIVCRGREIIWDPSPMARVVGRDRPNHGALAYGPPYLWIVFSLIDPGAYAVGRMAR